jgi:hypothetical protein
MSRRGTAGEDLDNDQTAAATGARLWEHGAVGRVNVLGAGGLGMRSWDVEELPCSREVVLALAFGEETVVTNAMETGREDVDEKAANEVVGSERHHLDACGSIDAVVLPLEGDAVVDGDEAAVGDGDAMGITRHVAQHLLGVPERLLGVDGPIGVAQGRQIGGKRIGIGEACVITKELQAPGPVRGEELFQTQSAEQS